MIYLKEIIDYLNNYLSISDWPEDQNGLLFCNSDKITQVVTGVSPSMELFKKAHDLKAELIITHHSMYLEEPFPAYQLNRLKFLKEKKISLANYHLPLDFHNDIGNEALTAKMLGLDFEKKAFYLDKYFIGGILRSPIGFKELIRKAEDLYGKKAQVISYGNEEVDSVAIITGSGNSFLPECFSLGLKNIITGNLKEESQEMAREMGLNVIAMGHYDTDKAGIKVLGERLIEKFDLKVDFVDIPNFL
jgi:dinuclear metal center YbgI/SA1388 family protein